MGKRQRDEADAVQSQPNKSVQEADAVRTPKASSSSSSSSSSSADADARKPSRAPAPSADAGAGAGAGADGGPPFTAFLSGLPYEASEDEIRELLAPAARAGALLELRAPRYQDSGRLRGYAHADFATRGALAAALALDRAQLRGRYVTIARAVAPGAARAGREAAGAGGLAAPRARPAGCRTVHVKGLPYSLDEDGVRAEIDRLRVGRVASVRIARHTSTGNAKGFGYVQFEAEAGADALMRAAHAPGGLVLGGRACSCDWDEGAPKASFRAASGQHFSKTAEYREHVRPAGHDAGKRR